MNGSLCSLGTFQLLHCKTSIWVIIIHIHYKPLLLWVFSLFLLVMLINSGSKYQRHGKSKTGESHNAQPKLSSFFLSTFIIPTQVTIFSAPNWEEWVHAHCIPDQIAPPSSLGLSCWGQNSMTETCVCLHMFVINLSKPTQDPANEVQKMNCFLVRFLAGWCCS